jgi:hypothetical protein
LKGVERGRRLWVIFYCGIDIVLILVVLVE